MESRGEGQPRNHEEEAQQGRVVYYDRHLWKRGDGTTVLDEMKGLLGRPDLREDQVQVVSPIFDEDNLGPVLAEGPATLVIPEHSIKVLGPSGNTVWLGVDPESFRDVAEKYGVDVYQLGKGKVWDGKEVQAQAKAEAEAAEEARKARSIRRRFLKFIGR